ncbi:hypothetical protein [Pseudobutyrivibrio sp.]|uniref:hypothetical protein n=1 Tax=Pseudobutyrivibrio sp. TaxID=2014367 RepID=UPI0038686CAA
MQEKRVPIIPIAVLIQAVIFLLMTSYGNMSLIPFSGRTVCVIALWGCIFALVDYVYTGEIEHAIKMAIIYAIIWCAIETGMEFLLNTIFEMGFQTAVGVWYGIQNVLCLGSVLAINYFFEDERKKIKKVLIVALVAILVAYIVAVYYTVQNATSSLQSSIFESVTTAVYQQDIMLKRMAAIFYGVEGALLSFCMGTTIK